MIDPHAILLSLAKRRPVFHSEADFQHEFAWELRSLAPQSEVRLEVPPAGDGIGTTDIVVRNHGKVHGIELKYLKHRFEAEVRGETFRLGKQSAQDQKRHGFLKDVERLEAFNRLSGGPSYAIALTNDPSYWNRVGQGAAIDESFRLYEGRNLTGRLDWSQLASRGSTGGSGAIHLSGNYTFSWSDFSAVTSKNGNFRYLCLKVE